VLADSYDVILIGESLPGLVAAALLARKGHRVLVVEPVDPAGPVSPIFKSDGFIFPKGPLLFLGLHREGLYEKVFTELGLSLSLLKKEGSVFARPVPPFQLLLPTHRLNFFSKWEEFLEELRREFPQEVQAAREFSKKIQETGRILDLFHHQPFPQWRPSLKDRSNQFLDLVQYRLTLRKLKRVSAIEYIQSYGLSLGFQKLMELVGLFFYRQPLSELRALDLVSLLNLVHQEVVEVREGRINLAKIFLSRLKEYRGELLRDSKLSGIV
jgi:phytoene dehydrogenase-like protein